MPDLASLALLLWCGTLATVGQGEPATGEPVAHGTALPSEVPLQLDRWTMREGLPQGVVTSLALDREGTLWVGTFGGLVRFDGVRFEPLAATESAELRNNRVTALTVGRDGTLWIGTEHDGVFARTQGGSIERAAGIRTERDVRRLLEDSKGALWCGLAGDEGLLREGQAVPGADRVGIVDALVERVPGEVWVAGAGGLYVVRDGHCRRLSRRSHRGLARRSDGALWASVSDGETVELWTSEDGPQETRRGLPEMQALLMDRRGGLVIAGTRRLLRWGERAQDLLDSTHLPEQRVEALLEDHEGSLWIGSSNGLLRVRRSPLSGVPGWEGSGDEGAAGVPLMVVPLGAGPSERLLVVDYAREVRLYDARDGGWQPWDLVPYLDAVVPCGDGSLLVSNAERGILRVRGGQVHELGGALTHGAPTAGGPGTPDRHALLETSQGRLWAGDLAGHLSGWTPDDPRAEVFHQDLGLGTVLFLLEARDGDLWVGARRGVAHLRDGELLRRWTRGADFAGGDVRALHQGPDGSLWAGTYGGGLHWLNGQGHFRRLGPEQGLHENTISRILADHLGHLVLLGNRALSRVPYDELLAVARGDQERIYPQVFSSGPGIDTFEGNGGHMQGGGTLASGVMWFPTREGLARFDPRVLESALPAPRMRITSLEVDGDPWTLAATLSIPPCDRDLTFRFTANTFVDSDQARFRYRLQGYDSHWIDSGRGREAVYTHVPRGRFTFQVQGANRDGVWSEQPASLELELEPWLHETLWFRTLMAAGLVLGGLGLLRLRTRVVLRRAQDLEQVVALRTGELIQARDHLEERVEERTRQLRADSEKRERLELELHRAQRFEAIGRLAGGIAHDFNNYLMVVVADSEMALESLPEDDHEVRPLVREIRDVSDRAVALTRQLLAYSGRQVLEPRPTDVNQAIDSLHPMLRRLVRDEVRLQLELAPTLPPALVDPGQLEQVLLNLVINAQQAIDGTGRILIRTECRRRTPGEGQGTREPADFAVVTVMDTGHGIDEGTLEHIFEPFFTTKSMGEGAGLGLASVFGIVEQSGGHLEVESQPSEGSCFRVWLPLAKERARAPEPEAPLPGTDSRGRILVCEDQDEVSRVLVLMLESFGHEVLAFDHPERLLEAVRNSLDEVDLLITDMVMPGMGGRELAAELHRRRPELQVLFLSGYSPKEMASLPLGRGVAFLQKPFGMAQLEAQVAELLAHRVEG